MSHVVLHAAQAFCRSEFGNSCARWDQRGEAHSVDWTLALAQDDLQQKEEQMALSMY